MFNTHSSIVTVIVSFLLMVLLLIPNNSRRIYSRDNKISLNVCETGNAKSTPLDLCLSTTFNGSLGTDHP